MSPILNIGLKLFSTNIERVRKAEALYADSIFDYIEIYVVPGSYDKNAAIWRSVEIPFVVHAAHFGHGINFARRALKQVNKANFLDARRFADALGAELIIVHGGNGGTLEEAIKQIRALDDDRIAIENKPKLGLNGEICVGWSPDEFERYREGGVLKHMALDFGHAACAAISSGADPVEWATEFLRFNPDIFHLVDGNGEAEQDHHLNLGRGRLPLRRFVSMIPDGGRVTLETPHEDNGKLRDFVKDVSYLRHLIATRKDGL